MKHNLEIISHRGASAYCTDNSYESIHKAIKLGGKIIEVDVRLTKDLEIVLSHDNIHTVNGNEKIIKNSFLEELYDIHELNIILSSTPEEIIFYLDVKCEENEIIFIKRLNDILETYPNRIFYIASFSDTFILLFKSLYTNYKLGIIFSLFNNSIYRTLQNKVDFIVTEISQTEEFTFFLQIKDKTKYLYTINNLELVKDFIQDIDGIVTDYPDII